jgi:octaprenyl-diphosphate synthase
MGRDELLKLFPISNLPSYIADIDSGINAAGADTVFKHQVSAISERGGKRLRPILLIASASLCGRDIDEHVIKSATAIELIHEASLVHDDSIDGDSMLKPAEALLLGDFMIASSLGLASSLGDDASRLLPTAVKAMAEGQAMQLGSRYKPDVKDDFYINTISRKTAVLFEAACQLGGEGRPAAKIMKKYGQAFGKAFQIIDDIADNDFEPSDAKNARRQALKYCELAARALEPMPASPLRYSLAEFPKLYLELALP